MANFNTSDAARVAAELVKAALTSGELKLMGPNSSDEAVVKRRATADATYLSSLINELAAGIQSS
jgi:hypothetical protein